MFACPDSVNKNYSKTLNLVLSRVVKRLIDSSYYEVKYPHAAFYNKAKYLPLEVLVLPHLHDLLQLLRLLTKI